MLPASVIAKKRDGGELTRAEIRFLIDGLVSGQVADYQISAWAMAVFLRGMTPQETAELTLAMLDSGERLPISPRSGDATNRARLPRADKHSTGGLGDKVSLILAPLLACHGVVVPMISGRGLGLTGGTLDKLEAIPGFRVDLDASEQARQLDRVGCFIIGASERIAPADRRLYALRDVTATVESVPLITASILAKKLAASLDRLVIDVKVGSAAFMKTLPQASELAHSLVGTGRLAGLETTAMLTDMDQPLGRAIGNACEVNEAWEVLTGKGPPEVVELTLRLAAQALLDVGSATDPEAVDRDLRRTLRNGVAAERFVRMVEHQGGRFTGPLPLAPATERLVPAAGSVAAIDCERLGRCVVELGGGRRRVADRINPAVGLEILVRIGDRVETGQPWLRVRGELPANLANELDSALTLVDEPIAARPLILDTVSLTGNRPAAPAGSSTQPVTAPTPSTSRDATR